MDSVQRLAIVTRRFWPHCGPVEIGVGEIAAAIRRAGHDVEILTVRWEKSWPRNFSFREVDVTRLGRPASGPWGMYRFVRTFSRHIRDSNYDGAIVFGLSDESWAAIRSCVKKIPVTVRIDYNDLNPQGLTQFNSRQLSALQSVTRILVDSQHTRECLIRHNDISTDLISVVPACVEVDPSYQRTLVRQNAARMALSDAHPILMVEAAQPLVVCGSPIFGDSGMFDLVEAWKLVLRRFPQARLWILGDGAKARQVWEFICDLNLANSIVMPGYFDDLSDVFQAANLYVHPLRSDGGCSCLVRALACGVCTIATATRATTELIDKNVNGWLTTADNPTALAEAIGLGLNSSDLRDRLGRAAIARANEQFNLDERVTSYLEHFSSLAEPQPLTVQQ